MGVRWIALWTRIGLEYRVDEERQHVSVAIVLAIHYGTDGSQNLEQEPTQTETAD